MSLLTRQSKGSELTHSEMDGNLTYLDTKQIAESQLPGKTATEIADFVWNAIQVKLAAAGYSPSGTPLAQSAITFGTTTATSKVVNFSAVANSVSRVLQYLIGSTWTTIYEGTATTFNQTGLTPSTSYSYRVISLPANGYAQSISATATNSTSASTGEPSGILVPKFIIDGQGTSSEGTLVSASAGMRSIAARLVDTGSSTLFVKSIEIAHDASWNGKEFTIGLTHLETGGNPINYPTAPSVFSFSFFKYADGRTVGKTMAIENLLSYNLQDNALTRIKIDVVNDNGFCRCFIKKSDDAGQTPYMIINTVNQGGQAGYLSNIPFTDNLFAQLFTYDAGVTFNQVKY
jgi:hypothetical protein